MISSSIPSLSHCWLYLLSQPQSFQVSRLTVTFSSRLHVFIYTLFSGSLGSFWGVGYFLESSLILLKLFLCFPWTGLRLIVLGESHLKMPFTQASLSIINSFPEHLYWVQWSWNPQGIYCLSGEDLKKKSFLPHYKKLNLCQRFLYIL